ncbi:MAG: 4-hydroxybenzoate octaprenyltransferase [Chloroflexi bacterium]|nr:4-hydroxybenzoate octaprenyltransferase [Chloroflexota bacterium]
MSIEANRGGGSDPGFSPVRRLQIFLETIKFEHSIFALPFAIAAAFMVAEGWPDWIAFGWVIIAMVTLRTFAMAANRILDAEIDRRNPRTADRALARGIIGKPEVIGYMIVSAVVFVVAAWQLDPLALWLSPIPIAVAFTYPYLKRFTYLAHFGIGAVYVIVPPAVSIAMTGTMPPEFVLLGIAALLWVSGFDVLYGIADIEFDRANGLHSIPARFGVKSSLSVAKAMHMVTLVFLVATVFTGGGGILAALGILGVGILFAYEHSLVKENDLSKLNMAFFTMNGIIAVVFAVFIVLDELIAW